MGWAIHNAETGKTLLHNKSHTTWIFPTRDSAVVTAKRLMESGKRTLDGKLMLCVWDKARKDWASPEPLNPVQPSCPCSEAAQ